MSDFSHEKTAKNSMLRLHVSQYASGEAHVAGDRLWVELEEAKGEGATPERVQFRLEDVHGNFTPIALPEVRPTGRIVHGRVLAVGWSRIYDAHLPLPADLSSGDYRVTAAVEFNALTREAASATFKIRSKPDAERRMEAIKRIDGMIKGLLAFFGIGFVGSIIAVVHGGIPAEYGGFVIGRALPAFLVFLTVLLVAKAIRKRS
jgi:hypothetical protein